MKIKVLFVTLPLFIMETTSKMPNLNKPGIKFSPFIPKRYLPIHLLHYPQKVNSTKTRRIPILTTTFENQDIGEYINETSNRNTTRNETEIKIKYLRMEHKRPVQDDTQENQLNVNQTENYNYCGVHFGGKVTNTADIENFPWLGVLIYPEGTQLLTTPVVLVTRELVITSAIDLNNLPKNVFRERAKVTLGHDCTGPRIGVLTYTYHPDYKDTTVSSLALVQLNTSFVYQDLQPICPPPKEYFNAKFYAKVLPNDCKKSKFNIFEMEYVASDDCKTYYKNVGLDIKGIWPVHLVCAKSPSETECVWRSGVPLVLYQQNRWHLVGFGIPGPGCGAPSRFLDYGQTERWVKDSHLRTGQPSISIIADNYIILRRARTHIQRFGVCDPEEMKTEIFSDTTRIKSPKHVLLRPGRIIYNLTLLANVDYSCIIFKAVYDSRMALHKTPKILLRRYCLSPTPLCYEPSLLEISFYLEVYYYDTFFYSMHSYGKEWKGIDSKAMLSYTNHKRTFPPIPVYVG